MTSYQPNIRAFITILVIVSLGIFALVANIEISTKYEKYRSLIAPTTIVTIVWFLWILFDKFFWKMKISRMLGLSKQPDLNGKWTGDIDRLGEENPHHFTMEINQTFSKISVKTRSENSSGHSIKAYFLSDAHNETFELVNLWHCRTKKRQKTEAFEEFKGLSQVSILEENGTTILEDYYFTDRVPPTAGRSNLVRI